MELGEDEDAHAPFAAAMRASRAASRLPSAQIPFTTVPDRRPRRWRSRAPDVAPGTRGHLGRMGIDRYGGDTGGSRNISQMLAKTCRIDVEVVLEWQEDGRMTPAGNHMSRHGQELPRSLFTVKVSMVAANTNWVVSPAARLGEKEGGTRPGEFKN